MVLVKKCLLTSYHNTTEDELNKGENSNTDEGDSDINGGVPEQQYYHGSRSEHMAEERRNAISDTVKVASGHLIRLKCKAGVT